MKDFDEDEQGNLAKLGEDLKAGMFKPFPVRRVTLHEQKPDGRVKRRPLGIPSIRDRIVQEALRMVLEPIFEADFCEHSYGFRPNRHTMDAVGYLGLRLRPNTGNYFWIIAGDIASYFDTINHRKLLRLLRRRIQDEKGLDLVWKFLRAGVMEKKLFRDTFRGTPQGGIVSPLLANIYLHELDRYMERHLRITNYERRKRRSKGEANFLYVRYADDFVVLCNGTKAQAEAMRQELSEFLGTTLKLNLSMEKTRVTHVNDGFKFLGFWIQRMTGTSGRCVPKILIPDEAKKKFLHKMELALNPSTHQESVAAKILALNRILNGWGHYYRYTANARRVFGRLDSQVFWLMGHWLGRKYKTTMPEVMRRFWKDKTYRTNKIRLRSLCGIPSKRYLARRIPNPYTTRTPQAIDREDIFSIDAMWSGREVRGGRMDWRDLVLERDGAICAECGLEYPEWELELDHKTPRARFRRAKGADFLENFQLLCTPHHRNKTKKEQQVLSRVR